MRLCVPTFATTLSVVSDFSDGSIAAVQKSPSVEAISHGDSGNSNRS
jgi:hypothetical protein